MKIEVSNSLVAALRREYRDCLPDAAAVGEMVETLAWSHLRLNGDTRRKLDEHRAVPAHHLAPE